MRASLLVAAFITFVLWLWFIARVRHNNPDALPVAILLSGMVEACLLGILVGNALTLP